MINTSLVEKVIDFLSKPINTTIIAALFLTSAFIFAFNFVPEETLERMNLLSFLNEYNYIVFIALVGSFFILVIQGVAGFLKRKKDKEFAAFYKEQQEDLFNDSYAFQILEYMYEKHPEQVKLPIQNQKVKLLNQYGLIVLAGKETLAEWYNLDDPHFPFVLQPIAEKKLKEIKR